MTTIISAEDKKVKDYVDKNARYFKMRPIEARLPTQDEIGQKHITYVLDDGALVEEGNNIYTDSKVVVRFPTELASGIFNEWLVDSEKFKQKYGKLPNSNEWVKFYKEGVESFAVIDEELMNIFGAKLGSSCVEVAVSWATDGKMKAYLGGLATGYHVIAPGMAKIMYDEVE